MLKKYYYVFFLLMPQMLFAQISNSQCFACHSNTTLQKTIEVSGGTEVIPLYVNESKFNLSKHGSLSCIQCHIDITSANLYTHASGGANSLIKTYGGWARFSKSDTTLNADGSPRTRNYTTAASIGCASTGCHASKSNFTTSRHHTIWRLKQSHTKTVNGETVGENYDKTCSRCHTNCSTCHFKTNITQKYQGDLLAIWDSVQTLGESQFPNAGPMSEWSMDWTKNIESHEFITASELNSSTDICRSCHVGYYRPSTYGYLSEESPYPTAYGTSIKRHPQYYELMKSPKHSTMPCTSCHSDVHSYPDGDFDWQTLGDAQCSDCHNPTNHYTQHTTVDCISCHATGFAKSFGQQGHDVWRWPNNGRVRPLAVKYKEALSWYPHSIEKPDPVTSCANKCHYEGNLIGAITDVKIENTIPKNYDLLQNYPNPFNPSTTLTYMIAKSGNVTIGLYDALGKKVKSLFDGNHNAGKFQLNFNGAYLTSGVYFVKMNAGQFTKTIKMILLK